MISPPEMEEHRADHRVLVHRTGEVTVESDLCTAGSLDPVERLNSARRQYQAHADALSGAGPSTEGRASSDRAAGSERTEKDLLIRDLQAENRSLRATVASLMASTGATLDDLASAQARAAARLRYRPD